MPTTLPSVKQTDGEREREGESQRGRERERDMKVGGGWERWRESSNSAHRSNEHFLCVSEV